METKKTANNGKEILLGERLSAEMQHSFIVHTEKEVSLISADSVCVDNIGGKPFMLFCNASSTKISISFEKLKTEYEGNFSMITFSLENVKLMYQIK